MAQTTKEISLPASVSTEILNQTANISVVQQLAKRQDIAGQGDVIRIATGGGEAYWVGEAEKKPTTEFGVKTKTVAPSKLVAMTFLSTELVEDDEAFYNYLKNELPAKLALKFDQTVLNGVSNAKLPFDTLADAEVPTIALKAGKHYQASLDALSTLTNNGANLNSFLLNSKSESNMLGELDNNGRPLFIDSVVNDNGFGKMIGRDAKFTNRLNDSTFAIAGDFSKARWGTTASYLVFKVADQATIDNVSMFQTNQVALLVEQRIYFAYEDPKHFVRITNPTTPTGK